MKDAVTGLPYDVAHVISVVTGITTTIGDDGTESKKRDKSKMKTKGEDSNLDNKSRAQPQNS